MKTLSMVGEMLAQWQPGSGSWGWHHNMMGDGGGIVVFILIFLGLAIVGVVFLTRHLPPQSRSKPSEDALEILERRYARGEIQKGEFEEKRRDLGS